MALGGSFVGSSKVPQLFERIERDGVAGGLLLSQKGLLNGRKKGLRKLAPDVCTN